MKDARQPILIVQGELDRQVPAYHADRLAELARARKRQAPVEVVKVPGVNHLLVPAKTGEVSRVRDARDQAGQPRGDRRAHRLADPHPRPGPARRPSPSMRVPRAATSASRRCGRAVDAAGKALGPRSTRGTRPSSPEMLNSAGSVSAEWYIETLWHYLHKRSLLQGVQQLRRRVQAAGPPRRQAAALLAAPSRAGTTW